jgi:acid stress-induced BolA-like protein IbaG/YrbA
VLWALATSIEPALRAGEDSGLQGLLLWHKYSNNSNKNINPHSMQQLQVQVQNINMEGTRLLICSVAPSLDVKNRVWNQIQLIDASFNDLICDLSVSQQQPTAAQSPATMTAEASVSGGQSHYVVKRVRYSFQDQSRLLW